MDHETFLIKMADKLDGKAGLEKYFAHYRRVLFTITNGYGEDKECGPFVELIKKNLPLGVRVLKDEVFVEGLQRGRIVLNNGIILSVSISEGGFSNSFNKLDLRRERN